MPVEHPKWATGCPRFFFQLRPWLSGRRCGPMLRVVARETSEFQRFRKGFGGVGHIELEVPIRGDLSRCGARAGLDTVALAEVSRIHHELLRDALTCPAQVAVESQPIGQALHQR